MRPLVFATIFFLSIGCQSSALQSESRPSQNEGLENAIRKHFSQTAVSGISPREVSGEIYAVTVKFENNNTSEVIAQRFTSGDKTWWEISPHDLMRLRKLQLEKQIPGAR